MEIKKSSKADLESKRIYFFLIGLIMTGSLLFIAIEWKYNEPEDFESFDWESFITLDEEIEIDNQEYTPQKPVLPSPVQHTAPTVFVEIYDVLKNELLLNMPDIRTWEEGGLREETWLNDMASLDSIMTVSEDSLYTQVEEMPEFPGGFQAFIRYLSQSIRYPAPMVNAQIIGDVVCSFVIDKTGRICQVEIIQGVHPALDRETMRVINNMPAWKPGRNRGREVSVKYIVPVAFRMH